jgi:hypothetical protein
MPFREGDVYRCPDQACGCELTGTKGSPRPCSGQQITDVLLRQDHGQVGPSEGIPRWGPAAPVSSGRPRASGLGSMGSANSRHLHRA